MTYNVSSETLSLYTTTTTTTIFAMNVRVNNYGNNACICTYLSVCDNAFMFSVAIASVLDSAE